MPSLKGSRYRHGFDIASHPRGVLQTIGDAAARRLPARYETDLWDRPFRARLSPSLKPGLSVLDVGAGRRPTIPRTQRPPGTLYVGLDPDGAELADADAGSYDGTVVSPAELHVASLEDRFDLVLSFFAFEHVQSMAKVLANLHAYLRPGGTLLGQFAGARSPFSMANRVLPGQTSRSLLARTQARDAETVFPARYDSCTHTALTSLLRGDWSEYEVTPLFTGAGYVLFSKTLTAAYIAYEEWIYRTNRRDLAPYYLVAART